MVACSRSSDTYSMSGASPAPWPRPRQVHRRDPLAAAGMVALVGIAHRRPGVAVARGMRVFALLPARWRWLARGGLHGACDVIAGQRGEVEHLQDGEVSVGAVAQCTGGTVALRLLERRGIALHRPFRPLAA